MCAMGVVPIAIHTTGFPAMSSNAQTWYVSVTMSLRKHDSVWRHLREVSSMQTLPGPDTASAHDPISPTVIVSMLDDHLVICAPAQLDLEMTEVLVIAAASAVAAGYCVMIDLDPYTTIEAISARRPLSAVGPHCVIGDAGPVAVLGAGYVRLATRDAHWTIDLAHGRLCRSDDAIEPHFVRPEGWTPIRALWVTQTSVTALTDDGIYLSTPAAWTIGHRTKRPTPCRPTDHAARGERAEAR